MPISKANAALYPTNWRAISLSIRTFRAQGRCESVPGQPTCEAEQGKRHPITGSVVVLTVAHLDHDPSNCAEDNLRALCQRCHNRYDRPHRSTNAAATRRAAKRTGELFS